MNLRNLAFFASVVLALTLAASMGFAQTTVSEDPPASGGGLLYTPAPPRTTPPPSVVSPAPVVRPRVTPRPRVVGPPRPPVAPIVEPPPPQGWDRPAEVPDINCGDRSQRFVVLRYYDFDPTQNDEAVFLAERARGEGIDPSAMTLARMADFVVTQAILNSIGSHRRATTLGRNRVEPGVGVNWWRLPLYGINLVTLVRTRDVAWDRVCVTEHEDAVPDADRFVALATDHEEILGVGVALTNDPGTRSIVDIFDDTPPATTVGTTPAVRRAACGRTALGNLFSFQYNVCP